MIHVVCQVDLGMMSDCMLQNLWNQFAICLHLSVCHRCQVDLDLRFQVDLGNDVRVDPSVENGISD